MTQIKLSQPTNASRVSVFAASRKFDWVIALFSLWFVSGLHLDEWAHHHEQVETFFTLWHGVLYSGFVVTALALVIGVWRNRAQSTSWQAAIPTGYSLSLVGAALFMFGGMADGVWHTLLGIEVDVEALLSPPHLLLAFGGALIVTGPLRAAWVRNENTPTLAQLLPAILSATLLLSLMAFFTQYASVLALAANLQRAIPGDLGEAIRSQGIAGVLVQTAVLMGLMLALARRWRMPFGSWTMLLTLHVLLVVAPHENWNLIPIGLVVGLLADVLMHTTGASRLFAVITPIAFFVALFATLALSGGFSWGVPFWSGALVLAGTVGWLMHWLSSLATIQASNAP